MWGKSVKVSGAYNHYIMQWQTMMQLGDSINKVLEGFYDNNMQHEQLFMLFDKLKITDEFMI